MATGGIIICKAAGTTYASDTAIAFGQSVAAGGSFAINGSLAVGGAWSNEGWGYKVKVVSAGNDSGKTLHIAGKFASDTAVGYTDTITVTMANASSATSSEYAFAITGARVATATASSVTIGLADDSSGGPIGLNHGSLYQITAGGTFAGATIQVKKYDDLNAEWVAFGTETGDTAAYCRNYEVPVGTIVKGFLTSGSTTTAIGIKAEAINKQR